MPYDVERSAAFGRSERETQVLLQLDRPVLGEDLATITAPRRAAPVPHWDKPVHCDDRSAGHSITVPRRAAPVAHDIKPVFSDDSGRRAAVLRWAGRGFCLIGVLLCAALGLTLRAHVSVPGLEGLFGSKHRDPAGTNGHHRYFGCQRRASDRTAHQGLRPGRCHHSASPAVRTDPSGGSHLGYPSHCRDPHRGSAWPVTADPLATVPAVQPSSAGKASPPALGKTKPRNPHAATPTPGGHGRPDPVG